jgi:hypothetical protein
MYVWIFLRQKVVYTGNLAKSQSSNTGRPRLCAYLGRKVDVHVRLSSLSVQLRARQRMPYLRYLGRYKTIFLTNITVYNKVQ